LHPVGCDPRGRDLFCIRPINEDPSYLRQVVLGVAVSTPTLRFGRATRNCCLLLLGYEFIRKLPTTVWHVPEFTKGVVSR
jgi:hypothetical protein